MKKLFTLMIIAAFTMTISAQTPRRMSYQAVVRNPSGALLTNQAVGMKVSILQGSATGTVVYSETYSPDPQTNANGLVTVEIGSGTPVTGSFTGINWAAGPYYLKTEIDPDGGTGYTITGTSQLLSVPYALYAVSAENVFSGNYNDLTNRPLLFSGSYNDLTNKPTLFDGTWNSLTGKPAGFADGIDNIDDADNSITNEIQALSLSGTVLTLSNGGGSVTLPSSGGGDNWGTQVVVTDATLAGNGTTAIPLRIADNGVTSVKIADGTVSSIDLANNSVTTLKIADGSIATADLANSTVTTDKLDDVAVSTAKIQNGAITSDKLATNSVISNKINAGAVTGAKIAQEGATSGQVLKWNGSLWAPADDETGEGGLTLPYSGTGTSDSPLFDINNLGTSGAISTFSSGNYGIWGESGNSTGIGVYGVNKITSGTTYGVFGDVYSSSGFSGFFQGGKFYVQGNTGIGTQNPGAKLEVAGQVKITGGNPGAGKILTSDGEGLASWVSPSVTWLKNGNNVYYNSGNVGIGLSNPTGMMEIYGNSVDNYPTLLLSEADGYARVSFRTMSASSKHWVLAGHTNLTDASSQLHLNYFDGSVGKNIFSVYGNSNIAFDGNVGIGTTAPSSKLEVAGQIKITGGTPGTGKVLTSNASGLASWQSPELSPWLKNGSDIYYNSGNVAIGTTFPRYNLTIYHDNNPLIGFYNSTSGTTGSDGFTIGTYSSGSPVWIWNWENSNMHFGTNNLNRMIIDADGHVSFMRYLDINTDGTFGALYVAGSQALWWDGTYFSWGYGGTWNYFADKVYIGPTATDPGANHLVVNGSAAKPGGGSWATWSDGRLKDIHGVYSKGLSEIVELKPVSFSYRKDNAANLPDDREYAGLVAQEVQKVFPEAVTSGADGFLQFDMHPVNIALINAVRELKADNDRLKSENEQINSRLARIEKILSEVSKE